MNEQPSHAPNRDRVDALPVAGPLGDTATLLETIDAALQYAESHGELSQQVLCLMAKAETQLKCGQGMEALLTALAAERLVIRHPDLRISVQGVVRLGLASLYRNVVFDAAESGRLLTRAYRMLIRRSEVDLVALVQVYLRQSDHGIDLGDSYKASEWAASAKVVLELLPNDAERIYHGRPLSYWRVCVQLQRLWVLVASCAKAGEDCDADTELATAIDSDFWAMARDVDHASWRQRCPELAFRFAYMEAWLGFDVVYTDAILFVGWEKQLFWRALRRPPGQVQVSLPLCLNLEEVPVSASRIPLLRELGVQALGRAST